MSIVKKAVVLSSGGVDSTTCLGLAISIYGAENVTAVSIYYGQKHDKELKCAEEIAKYYGVKHYTLDLSSILKYSNCSLMKNSTEEIEHLSYIEQKNKTDKGMVSTYVPFRNGLMLSAVTSLAVSIYPNDEVHIYLGAHADDAAGSAYADCTVDFTYAMKRAINLGTYEKVFVETPLISFNKAKVVETGTRLGVPYELTWSCYEGGDKPCLTCGTCRDAIEAFHINNRKYTCKGYTES